MSDVDQGGKQELASPALAIERNWYARKEPGFTGRDFLKHIWQVIDRDPASRNPIVAEHLTKDAALLLAAGPKLYALLLEGVTGAKAMGVYLKEQRDVGLWADTEWEHWQERVDAALAEAVGQVGAAS